MKPPFTIGITGGSGPGKTYFIQKFSSYFNAKELCLVSQDHYYKPIHLQTVDENGIENFDLPESIDREKFLKDILTIKKGVSVSIQEYTFNNSQVKPKTIHFTPAPILLIEGLFVQYFPEIEQQLDLSIFIEAKDYVKLSRRISRDKAERGYDVSDVLYRYQHHVMPVYESLIEPLKHNADFIIPNNRNFESALSVLIDAVKIKLDQK